MDELYPHVLGMVRTTPWALDPRTLAVMLDLLRFRNAGGRLSKEQISERLGVKRGAARPDVLLVRDDGELVGVVGRGQPMAAVTGGQAPASVVAVIGIYGVISQRASQVDDISGPGGTSVERVMSRFRSSLNDPAVKAIVFDVDSPGGSVYGVPELADEIRAARGRKPMEAVSNALMASAAYYIASSADKVWVTPSGEAGSIGVYAAHVDLSKFYEQAGEKVTLVSYGKNKTAGNPFEPLSEDARADMEKRVGEYGRQFDKAVARSRGVTTARVAKDFGQGLVFGAKEATERGLADGVATLDEVLARVSRQKAVAQAPAAELVTGLDPAATVEDFTVTLTLTSDGVRASIAAELAAAEAKLRLLTGERLPS